MILVSKASSPTSEITYPQNTGAIFASGRFLHNLSDKLFNKVTDDLDLSEKQVGNPHDKFILHQNCVRATECWDLHISAKKGRNF